MGNITVTDRMKFITVPVPAGPSIGFRRLVGLRVSFGDIAAALELVRGRPQWKTDPEAVLQLGIIQHHFTLHSAVGTATYSHARYLYRRAATLGADTKFNAEALASAATAYLDERRLCEADLGYRESLSVDASNRLALLGRISVACARRSLAGVRQTCRELVTRISSWHQDHEVVAMLATNAHHAFLRASPALFVECFGGYPTDLQALHDRHRLDTLRDNVDAHDDDSRSSLAAYEDGTCAEPVVARGTGNHAVPREHPAALHGTLRQAYLLAMAYVEVEQAAPSTIRAHDADREVPIATDAYFAAIY